MMNEDFTALAGLGSPIVSEPNLNDRISLPFSIDLLVFDSSLKLVMTPSVLGCVETPNRLKREHFSDLV
jgi:hypothetical protein